MGWNVGRPRTSEEEKRAKRNLRQKRYRERKKSKEMESKQGDKTSVQGEEQKRGTLTTLGRADKLPKDDYIGGYRVKPKSDEELIGFNSSGIPLFRKKGKPNLTEWEKMEKDRMRREDSGRKREVWA